MAKKRTEIFSGPQSEKMWQDINCAQTIADLRDALYYVCCKLEEFETHIDKRMTKLEEEPRTIWMSDGPAK